MPALNCQVFSVGNFLMSSTLLFSAVSPNICILKSDLLSCYFLLTPSNVVFYLSMKLLRLNTDETDLADFRGLGYP